MRIARIEAIPLREAEETVLVVVEAEDGTRGYGEAVTQVDAVARVIESTTVDPVNWDNGVQKLLLGSDADDPTALWPRTKAGTVWSCRTGIGHVALAGIHMALWDRAVSRRAAAPRAPARSPYWATARSSRRPRRGLGVEID